jgi:hypothetical protein
MVYYNKILKETADAINRCFEKKYLDISVKRVRKCHNIPSSDRSRIAYYHRALEDLKSKGYLELLGRNSPKNYRIIKKIDLKNVIEKVN